MSATVTAAFPALEARLVSRFRAFGGLALADLATIAIVLVTRTDRSPTWPAVAALALIGALLFATALVERRADALGTVSARRSLLLVVAAAALAPVGYFFGPNSSYSAAVGLLVLLTGLLSRPAATGWTSWTVYALLAGGELVVTVLVTLGVLPDTSVTPVVIPGHPVWHDLAGQVAMQAVLLVAFLAGRGLRTRYALVAAELRRAHRTATLREALLDEARAEYRRALRLGRRGALTRDHEPRVSEPPPPFPPGSEPSTPFPTLLATAGGATRASSPPPGRASSPPPRASSPPPAARSRGARSDALWLDAYRTKMRGQYASVIGLCVFGAAFLSFLGPGRAPVWIAEACMGLILVLTLVLRAVAKKRGDESIYWPWALIAALAIGPAYAFGLHSAFACVIAALIFVGGSFRAAAGDAKLGRRVPVLLAVMATHGAVFSLIVVGVVPDAGNAPVLGPATTELGALVHHLLLQAIFATAFFSGVAIDTRYDALAREAARAAADASQKEAQLLRAGEEIDRVLAGAGEGLFTGDRIGRYEIGRLVASGGMGDVYEASTEEGGRVAVKLVRRQRASDPVVIELFAREASALARVRSTYVAAILEAGSEGGDLPYIAMELIDGKTLSLVLRERGRLPLPELRVLVAEVARGLRDVHDAGVIHRDLKPHNIMWTLGDDGPRWKLVDFGVAQLHDVVTAGDVSGGTPQYMSPEQALGLRVDPRADLYALGLVVYRALTGRPAFVGTDRVLIARDALAAGPPDPTLYAEAPEDVVLALRLALGPKPADRFATARELAGAFEAAFDGKLSEKHREKARTLLARAPWRGDAGDAPRDEPGSTMHR